MNKVVNDETSNLIILNQYIKDLSYENFQKNGTQNFNTKENNTNIEINVIHEPYGEINFGVSIKITINCKSKKKELSLNFGLVKCLYNKGLFSFFVLVVNCFIAFNNFSISFLYLLIFLLLYIFE